MEGGRLFFCVVIWVVASFFILFVLRIYLSYQWISFSDLFPHHKSQFNVSQYSYPYQHVIEQLEWISAFSHNEV